MAAFDHLAVSAGTLEAGTAHVEAALGVPLEHGGKHPHMGTHNRLLSLGPEEYLEVIAIDPDAPKPPHPRWFALDRFAGPPRLTNWIARVDDLDAALAAAPAGAGRATDLARGDFRWRFGVPADGCLPFGDAFPALIEWQGTARPAARLPDRGCRLIRLEITCPEPGALASALPVTDPRIVIAAGEKSLRATIRTPHGDRVLA
ncbi:MAG: VOC family protein [Albidovulum sp.]|uniref:VOC family protein n=1 Tax=Albidovulum sp. TaxID=1872424 RepID=UPI003C805E79